MRLIKKEYAEAAIIFTNNKEHVTNDVLVANGQIVATDGHVLIRLPLNVDNPAGFHRVVDIKDEDDGDAVMLSSKELGEAAKCTLKKRDVLSNVVLQNGANAMLASVDKEFNVSTINATSKYPVSAYPNFENIIPKSYDIELRVKHSIEDLEKLVKVAKKIGATKVDFGLRGAMGKRVEQGISFDLETENDKIASGLILPYRCS